MPDRPHAAVAKQKTQINKREVRVESNTGEMKTSLHARGHVACRLWAAAAHRSWLAARMAHDSQAGWCDRVWTVWRMADVSVPPAGHSGLWPGFRLLPSQSKNCSILVGTAYKLVRDYSLSNVVINLHEHFGLRTVGVLLHLVERSIHRIGLCRQRYMYSEQKIRA